MTYQPHFSMTDEMLMCAENIGAYRCIAQTLPLPLIIERSLRHDTRVRVAHNSTWIENRTLALQEVQDIIADKALLDPSRAQEQAAQEVRNYFHALDFIDSHRDTSCSEKLICELHALMMKGQASGRPQRYSKYRQVPVRVGEYMPPAWEDIPELMTDLCVWASNEGQLLPRYIFAGILAYQFVTIHPFADGNGRTCRALATWALRGGASDTCVDPSALLNVEELYAQDLQAYYDALQMGCHMCYYDTNEIGSRSSVDLSPWLNYFCRLLGRSARSVTSNIIQSFESGNVTALADPLAQYSSRFRRLLARIPTSTSLFTAAEVAMWFHVTKETAREWLKKWCSESLVLPSNPHAQRIHAYKLNEVPASIIAGNHDRHLG